MSYEDHIGPALPTGDRTTAPQSAFTMRQVGIGFAVLAVGLLLTVGLAVLVGI